MFIFPYEKKRIPEGELVDPRVNISLKTVFGFLKIKFLLDSGADVTTLPVQPYSELFRFRKNQEEKITIGGVEGKGVGAYPFKVTAQLESIRFPLRIFFIESNSDPLLGRLDFWNLFSITFDNKSQNTVLTPIK